ncbi:short chain dehydrogenase [Legionella antarctica]|uniref:Short chain dehydrogenase n=1 Tax=Legionella antarctica TaxID=2708020 RepID=A0A6F8T8Z4_9GAMM|nr:short chain dehydrogenase [Legionella antarctica]BCA96587.1 short chain dehydrogenase [Legionella antarctica]
MNIIIVGGTGTIGKAIVKELAPRHNTISVGNTHGDFHVDIADINSIDALYQAIGPFDALISATGKVEFAPLTEFTPEQYQTGLNSKLMGQVNLVLLGLKYINKGGSFTLTSGILSHDPVRLGSSASMVNGAIDSFIKSAAIEMPEGIRINAVSPTLVSESVDIASYFRGFEAVPACRVALAYSKSVEGAQTGVIYHVE